MAKKKTRKKPYPKGKQAKQKVGVVMREFKEGKLRSSNGKKVTDRSQAVAIALSEARRKGAKQRTWKGRKRLRPPLKKGKRWGTKGWK